MPNYIIGALILMLIFSLPLAAGFKKIQALDEPVIEHALPETK